MFFHIQNLMTSANMKKVTSQMDTGGSTPHCLGRVQSKCSAVLMLCTNGKHYSVWQRAQARGKNHAPLSTEFDKFSNSNALTVVKSMPFLCIREYALYMHWRGGHRYITRVQVFRCCPSLPTIYSIIIRYNTEGKIHHR